MRTTFKIFLFATAAFPVLVSASAAMAQSSDTSGIETVTVTAERRAQPLFEVPATITAISGEELKNLGITDMKSIVAQIPNAVLPDDPENFETYINIRGIQQADINAEPNFGLYRNGIFTGGERANLGAQIDIDRVEVLSGPQSGLYGRDAVGGVVDIVYATPTMEDHSGYVIASYGRYDRSELQGATNIPITDNFALRATGWWINQNEGQLYNSYLDQYIDRNKDIGGRLSAKWEVNNQLSVLWMAELQDKHGPSFDAYTPNGLSGALGINCCGFPVSPAQTMTTIQEDTPDTEKWQQFYLSQDINYDTKSWLGTFELLGSYRNYHLSLQEDQDHTAFGADYAPGIVSQIQYRTESLHNIYGELIWKSPEDQRLTWMAGVDYFDETFGFERIFSGSMDFNLLNQPFAGPNYTYGNLFCSFLVPPYDGGCEATPPFPSLPGAGPHGSYPYLFPNAGVQSAANALGGPGSGIDTRSYSAFATATYKIMDDLSLTGDIRWDQTQKQLNYSEGSVAGFGTTPLGAAYLGPLFAEAIFPYTSSQTDTFVHISPSATLQYTISDTANVYATYATGFRAGGFNLGTSTPSHLPYSAEKDQNFEIGTKTMWLDGRLGINADVFYMPQSDLLETEPDPAEPAFIGLYYLANIGSARTYGAEMQALYRATDWLNLGTSVGWLDDRLTSGASGGIPFTRNWTVNFTADAAYPVGDDVALVADADWRLEYGGDLDIATVPYANLSNLDLDVGVTFGQTRVVGYIDNAFNDIVDQFEYYDGAVNVSQGRTFGIRIEQKF